MKVLTTIVSAAVLAVSLAATTAAHSAIIAQFTPDTAANDYRWINNGPGNSGTGGHLFSINNNAQTVANGVKTHFSYLDGTLLNAAFIPATFKVDATVVGVPAAVNGAGVWTQTNVNGSFSFIYTGATIANYNGSGVTLVHNSNLLSGVFTDAWIQGAGGSGSINLAPINGGSLTYTSDYDTNPQDPGTQEFAWNILQVNPPFNANAGKALAGFRANGGGNFSASSTSVPEPAAWGLMILGFGGIGAVVRNRRRTALTA